MKSILKNTFLLWIKKPIPFAILAIIFSVAWLFQGSWFLNVFGIQMNHPVWFVFPVLLILLLSLYFVNISTISNRVIYSLAISLSIPFLTLWIGLMLVCILPPHNCL